jgi:4a-hydroxytetrahydrobiopterin dehydratase
MVREQVKAIEPHKVDAMLFQINSQLKDSWQYVDDCLLKTFMFSDFTEAFAFMTRCALIAERSNHHPEWHNVYNRVTIRLTTHEADGVSHKDFELLQAIENI